MDQELVGLLTSALEWSYFLAPDDPGLTYDEIQEFGKRLGYQPGEIGDALRAAVGPSVIGSKRWHPNDQIKTLWMHFMPEEPELRNFNALDFIVSELNASVRAVGSANARSSATW